MNNTLAILLPVQNAQATLTPTVLRALEVATELTRRCEVAIIDDGSVDDTEEIACDLALQYPQVLVARHHRPRGLDDAIHTGVEATHGGIIIVVPPQCKVQPAEVRRLWRIGTGEVVADLAAPLADAAPTLEQAVARQSSVVARLMKWGQALREENARRQSGLYMIRRELYRRRQRSAARGFQPSRVDAKTASVPTAPPNFATRVRDFAFGE